MKNFPIDKVNRLIEPGPIVLVTTFHHGKPNIMTMGFHMNPDRKEQRTMHHHGDGSFKIDGRTIDLRKRMVKWQELVD